MKRKGEWKRSYLEGSAETDAFASDFAELVTAYLELHQSSGEPGYLVQAAAAQEAMDRLFWDAQGGGYYDTRESTELPARSRQTQDGAIWSANSRAALNLMMLYRLTGETRWVERAERLFSSLAPTLTRYPHALPGTLSALELYYGKNVSIVLTGNEPLWWAEIHRGYHPERLACWVRDREGKAQLKSVVEHVEPLPLDSAVYICEDFSCGLPITSLDELKQVLSQ